MLLSCQRISQESRRNCDCIYWPSQSFACWRNLYIHAFWNIITVIYFRCKHDEINLFFVLFFWGGGGESNQYREKPREEQTITISDLTEFQHLHSHMYLFIKRNIHWIRPHRIMIKNKSFPTDRNKCLKRDFENSFARITRAAKTDTRNLKENNCRVYYPMEFFPPVNRSKCYFVDFAKSTRLKFIFRFRTMARRGGRYSYESARYSLLGFSVWYNGVLRNKTEKTKETAGTRVGSPGLDRPRAGVTAKHTPAIRATVDGLQHADKCTPRRCNGQLGQFSHTDENCLLFSRQFSSAIALSSTICRFMHCSWDTHNTLG